MDRREQKLLGWLAEVGAEMPAPDPEYDPELDRDRHDRIVDEVWPRLERQRSEYLSKDWQPNRDWWGSESE